MSPTSPSLKEDVPHNLTSADPSLRKPAAGDLTSNRPGWKSDSPSWQIFSQKHGAKEVFPSGTAIEEEDEDAETRRTDEDGTEADVSTVDDEGTSGECRDDDRVVIALIYLSSETLGLDLSEQGIPRSVPIPIGVLGSRKTIDYEIKTSLRDRPAMHVPALHKAGLPSSLALRKATYAERDRIRAMDPGTLDFADEDTDEDTQTDGEDGERGRKHAQKILKARSELPAASMWRSMA
jgi:hypothetical protein